MKRKVILCLSLITALNIINLHAYSRQQLFNQGWKVIKVGTAVVSSKLAWHAYSHCNKLIPKRFDLECASFHGWAATSATLSAITIHSLYKDWKNRNQ